MFWCNTCSKQSDERPIAKSDLDDHVSQRVNRPWENKWGAGSGPRLLGQHQTKKSLNWANWEEQQKDQICRQEQKQSIAKRIARQFENIISKPHNQRGIEKQNSRPKERHHPRRVGPPT
jgi:hypothetical protein